MGSGRPAHRDGNFAHETETGWQTVLFSTPISVIPGATYTVSYHTNVGRYSLTANGFAAPYSRGPLQVPLGGAVYRYGRDRVPVRIVEPQLLGGRGVRTGQLMGSRRCWQCQHRRASVGVSVDGVQAMTLTWDRVFAWRMRRHFLDRPARGTGAPAVVRRLCGVQAQVASCAELAVAARQAKPVADDVSKALKAQKVIRTWAMRGTLHLLVPEDAPAYLSLVAAAKVWTKPVWQRSFATLQQMEAITEAVRAALDGTVLTREQLTEAVIEHTKDASIKEHMTSGWGAVLKPLAFQGHLVNGPSEGGRVTFTRPDTYLDGWKGLPEPAEAARTVIPAYLGTYGPATIDVFNQWLLRGGLKKTDLKSWYADLVDAGELVTVDVEGQPAYALARDVDAMARAKPFDEVRLLPGLRPVRARPRHVGHPADRRRAAQGHQPGGGVDLRRGGAPGTGRRHLGEQGRPAGRDAVRRVRQRAEEADRGRGRPHRRVHRRHRDRTDHPMITTRGLNRATLHRQLLLERAARSAYDTIEHLVGMQAQEPFSAVLRAVVAADGVRTGRAVRVAGEPPRGAGAAVPGDDPPGHRRRPRPDRAAVPRPCCAAGSPRHRFRSVLDGLDVDEFREVAADLVEKTPRTRSELASLLASRWPALRADSLGIAVSHLVPVVQVPPRGVWGRSGRAAWTTAASWLGSLGDATDLEPLVRRYLAAFGPASVKDIQTLVRPHQAAAGGRADGPAGAA